MSLRGRILILFVNFDAFIALRSDHPEGAAVELEIKNSCLARQRAWLYCSFYVLEVMSACPIEETKCAIVSSTYKHVI